MPILPKNKPAKIILTTVSISRSQAQLMAEGFLDQQAQGLEGKSGLQPRETFTELFLIVGELIEDAQNNLIQDNSNASGGLSKSIIADEPQQNGNIIKTDVLMAEHGQYINKGVRGTRSGKGQYQFRTENPSPRMLASLARYKGRAKKSTSNPDVKKYKAYGQNELKNQKRAQISLWGAAVNIKRYGIKPTGFMDKAIDKARKKVEDRLGDALVVDIINSI